MAEFPKNELEVYMQSWIKLVEPLTKSRFPVKLPKDFLNKLEVLHVMMLDVLNKGNHDQHLPVQKP